MKKIITTLILLGTVFSLSAQLNLDHNRIRIGDEIIKQQVDYKEPGRAGRNILWDFSDLQTINDEYTLTYSSAPLFNDSIYILGYNKFLKKDNKGKITINADNLVVGTEHNTMYYYQQKGDSLLLLGHENPAVKLQYVNPHISMIFPLNYGKTIKSTYNSRGLYSNIDSIHTSGGVETIADAYGILILPEGDSISPVLRVKITQIISDENSTAPVFTALESYKWYTKGYRYPIFETVRNINLVDSTTIFATSFYYPPQDHFYLDTDPENQKLLDEMWDLANKNEEDEFVSTEEIKIDDLISYQIYPNPVTTNLTINYTMKEDNTVLFQLFSFDGNLVKQVQKSHLTSGDYSESMNCSNLSLGNYVLRITINGVFVNEKIIKL